MSNKLRVRSFEHSFTNRFGEVVYTRIQNLEMKVIVTTSFLFWEWNKFEWVKIDSEIVPQGICQQSATLGSTEWKSKWHGESNIDWINKNQH